MKNTLAAAAVTVCLIATPAAARDNSAYVQLAGGITAANDSDYDSEIDPDVQGTIEWGTGYDFAGALGYDFGGFRVEGEASLKGQSFDRVVSGGVTIDTSDDFDLDFTTYSFMANALVDIGPDEGINGFVGAGAGIAITEIELGDVTGIDSDSDSGFAWQLLAGVNFPVSEKVDVGLKYRFFNQSDLTFIVADDDDLNTEFSSHAVLLTATFHL